MLTISVLKVAFCLRKGRVLFLNIEGFTNEGISRSCVFNKTYAIPKVFYFPKNFILHMYVEKESNEEVMC